MYVDSVEEEVIVLAGIELIADMGQKLTCVFETARKTIYQLTDTL